MMYPATQTLRTPNLSERIPQNGQATSATNSSANPRVPTRSPTPSLTPIRSVTTNETLLFRKTRKDIENKQTANRYAQACAVVVDDAKGRRRDTADMFSLAIAIAIPAVSMCSIVATKHV